LTDRKEVSLQQIGGVCGILAPIIAFTLIFLAIASYPQFSWANNALSDLGVEPGVTLALFNNGLIISGAIALIFAIGLFFYQNNYLGRVGAIVLALACIALILIGIFPEDIKPTHFLVSVAFFVLLPISLMITTIALWLKRKTRMALFTLIISLAAALPWILYFTFNYAQGVAIPEAISGFASSIWIIVLGYKMIRSQRLN
jgi:hypothetical membrane protein